MSQVSKQTVIINLTTAGLDFVNGVFIDNSLNGSAFTMKNDVTGQINFVPPYSQANLSLLTTASTDNQQFTGESTGGVDVAVTFRNTEPLSDTVTSVIAAGTIVGAVTVQGSVTALPVSVNGTGGVVTIVAGSTSQLLFAANPARKGLLISNPASGAGQGLGIAPPESIFIAFGATPTLFNGFIEIAPGGYFQTGSFVDTRLVNVIALSATHLFTAIQYQ